MIACRLSFRKRSSGDWHRIVRFQTQYSKVEIYLGKRGNYFALLGNHAMSIDNAPKWCGADCYSGMDKRKGIEKNPLKKESILLKSGLVLGITRILFVMAYLITTV